jgi:two-component system chemotaxis response regulator CheY
MPESVRILVVEDTAELREDLTIELLDAGYGVVDAGDGACALAAFRRESPDLVICDINLPDMDGLSIVEAIRLDKAGRHSTPVIVVSAFSDENLRRDAEALGVMSFVVKPVDYARLLLLIAQCLENPGQRANSS